MFAEARGAKAKRQKGTKAEVVISRVRRAWRGDWAALYAEAEALLNAGIKSIAIFPAIDPDKKNAEASHAFDSDNIVCKALQGINKRFSEIVTIADVALDPYTDHGHDGLIINEKIDNDRTLTLLSKQALLLAEAGADIIAPSDMMTSASDLEGLPST